MTGRSPSRLMLAAFLAHCGEELVGFPEWATRNFGTTTPEYYLASHAVLLPAVMALGVADGRAAPGGRLQQASAASAAGLVTNALFHTWSTLRLREYSPGVITGLALVLPAGVYGLREAAARDGRPGLSRRRWWQAVALGAAFNAAAVASLRVDMPRLDGTLKARRR